MKVAMILLLFKIIIIQASFEKASSYTLCLASGTNSLILVRRGNIVVNGNVVNEHQLVVFERDGQEVEVSSSLGAELLVLNAMPIDEEICSHGPFVMSNMKEVKQAYEDYQLGKLGSL